MIRVEIRDDFDPDKIIRSGQCFRAEKLDERRYRFITGESCLLLEKAGEETWNASCSREVWQRVFVPYFDLDFCYSACREKMTGLHPAGDRAMEAGRGLRILRQDPFETLITFILSQRRLIPVIRQNVETLCARFGHALPGCSLNAFPTPEELHRADTDKLRACGLGYRAPYVHDTVEILCRGEADLQEMAQTETDTLLQRLMKFPGVGIKVASCVALFAYGRRECAPVDTWIDRIIREDFQGRSPFPLYGPWAGVMQQYLFFTRRENPQPLGSTEKQGSSRQG